MLQLHAPLSGILTARGEAVGPRCFSRRDGWMYKYILRCVEGLLTAGRGSEGCRTETCRALLYSAVTGGEKPDEASCFVLDASAIGGIPIA